ncbi:hypothetical protein BC832DRAFT_454434 [Gaertneriomyces semiglobifer]|nr:hypothetical protein BC832DRAFT_454434 [Gaertneriomyces semiglobifer]
MRFFQIGIILATALFPAALAQNRCREYSVKPGEWCDKIAQDHSITLAQLISFNPGLNCNAIAPAQRLCVSAGVLPPPPSLPANPDGTCKYRDVQPGDWCDKIATSCGTSLAAPCQLQAIRV